MRARLKSERKAAALRQNPFICYCSDTPQAPAPDPNVGLASKEMAQVARDQLQWNKDQYNEQKPYLLDAYNLSKQVTQQQMDLAGKSAAQADDYNAYMKGTFRPVEQSLVDQSMVSPDAAMNEAAMRSHADNTAAFGNQRLQQLRQMASMGVNPNSGRFAAANNTMGIQQAAADAGGMTNARSTAKQLSWAQRMDASSLGRGLPGNQATSTGLALQGGTSAMNSTAVPMGLNTQMNAGYNAGVGVGLGGLQGSGQMLNQQYATQMGGYNAALNASGEKSGAMLGVIGSIAAKAAPYAISAMSDRRLKENIERVGTTAHDLGLYDFNYIGDKTRFRGVMADEVERVMPEAVVYDDLGFAAVNYGMLGIKMVEV